MRPCGVDRSNAIPLRATSDTRRVSISRKVASRSVVLRPAGQLGYQHRIDLAPLCERHDLPAFRTHAGGGFFVGANHLVAGPFGKGGEVALLPLAGLVRRGHPAIERGATAMTLAVPIGLPLRGALQALVPAGAWIVAVRLYPFWDGLTVNPTSVLWRTPNPAL